MRTSRLEYLYLLPKMASDPTWSMLFFQGMCSPCQEPATSHQPTMSSPAPAPPPFMTTCQAWHLSLSSRTETIMLLRTGRHSYPSPSFTQTLPPFTLSDQSHCPPLQLRFPPLPTSSQLPRTFPTASAILLRHRHSKRPLAQPS